MIRKLITALSISLAATMAAGDIDYTHGILMVNEDWYGHQNSTVNHLSPDDPDGEYWHYRVIQAENPGVELGCTNQYGAIWNGRIYLIAKQDKDPGATIVGGRITVADATTLKVIKQLRLIDPSGAQCDGRAFCGVSATKGYVSTSNGIWVLDLESLEIKGQIEGSANPNAGGDNDKPADDPTGSLYFGQTGTMMLAAGRVFAVHQQYGLLVIDPEPDKVIDVLTMDNVDDAIEADTGTRPRRISGIGSTIVRSKDGDLWYSAAKNVQGTGAAVPYIVRVNPVTLEREVIRIEGDDIYPPSNSWYAWTPDPFCASAKTNTLYWCGGQNSWFTNYRVFRFDIDTRRVEKLLDFSAEPGDWHIYGCSLGIDPVNDELYASMFHKFVDPTYELRRYTADGQLVKTYPMISNYWFPSLPLFPEAPAYDSVDGNIVESHTVIEYRDSTLLIKCSTADEATVYNFSGTCVYRCALTEGACRTRPCLSPGIYIVSTGSDSRKIAVR